MTALQKANLYVSVGAVNYGDDAYLIWVPIIDNIGYDDEVDAYLTDWNFHQLARTLGAIAADLREEARTA